MPPPPPNHFKGKDKVTIHEDRDFVDSLTNSVKNQINPLHQLAQVYNSGTEALDELTGAARHPGARAPQSLPGWPAPATEQNPNRPAFL